MNVPSDAEPAALDRGTPDDLSISSPGADNERRKQFG